MRQNLALTNLRGNCLGHRHHRHHLRPACVREEVASFRAERREVSKRHGAANLRERGGSLHRRVVAWVAGLSLVVMASVTQARGYIGHANNGMVDDGARNGHRPSESGLKVGGFKVGVRILGEDACVLHARQLL